MFGDRPILLIIHSEAPRTAANTSYESHHTDPILKNLCILPIIDMYLAEIGKIMFQYKTELLPFKCMRFMSFSYTLFLRIIVSQPQPFS